MTNTVQKELFLGGKMKLTQEQINLLKDYYLIVQKWMTKHKPSECRW